MNSRINWISQGDANTRYFHLSVINRRRRNKISYFKDSNDMWITDSTKISEHSLTYFTNCFTMDHTFTNCSHLKNFILSFHKIDLVELDNPLQDFEITNAVFYFKPFKAPSRMAFTLIFPKPIGILLVIRLEICVI